MGRTKQAISPRVANVALVANTFPILLDENNKEIVFAALPMGTRVKCFDIELYLNKFGILEVDPNSTADDNALLVALLDSKPGTKTFTSNLCGYILGAVELAKTRETIVPEGALEEAKETAATQTEQIDIPLEMPQDNAAEPRLNADEPVPKTVSMDESGVRYVVNKVYLKQDKGRLRGSFYRFEITDKLTGMTDVVDRAFIDKIFENPRSTSIMDKYVQGARSRAVQGLYYERYTNKRTGVTDWHLRVSPGVEQVIGYGNTSTYTCTDVYKALKADGTLGSRATKYRIVNDTSGEAFFVTTSEIYDLCLKENPLNEREKYDFSNIHGLRGNYWQAPNGTHSWRIRTSAKVAVHPDTELEGIDGAKSDLEKCSELICTRVYKVQFPNSKRTLVVKYEVFGNEPYEMTTSDIINLCRIPGKTGNEAVDPRRIKGLSLAYVSAEDKWRVRVDSKNSPDGETYKPEVIMVDYDTWKATTSQSVEQAEQAIKEIEKETAAPEIKELVINKVLCEETEKGRRAVGFDVTIQTPTGEVVQQGIVTRKILEETLGEPSKQNAIDARRHSSGIDIKLNRESTKWLLKPLADTPVEVVKAPRKNTAKR